MCRGHFVAARRNVSLKFCWLLFTVVCETQNPIWQRSLPFKTESCESALVPCAPGPRHLQAPSAAGSAQLPAPPRAPGDEAQFLARGPPPQWHHGPQTPYGGPGGPGPGLPVGAPPPFGSQNPMPPLPRGPHPRAGPPFNPGAGSLGGAPPPQFQDARGPMPRGRGGHRPGGMGPGAAQPEGRGAPQGSWMPQQAHEMRPRGMMHFRGPGPGPGPSPGFPPRPQQHQMGAPPHVMLQGPGPMHPPDRLGPGGHPEQARGAGPPGPFGPHPGWQPPAMRPQQQRPPGNVGGTFAPAGGQHGPMRPLGEGPVRPAVPPTHGPRGPMPGAGPKLQWVTRIEGGPPAAAGPETSANGRQEKHT